MKKDREKEEEKVEKDSWQTSYKILYSPCNLNYPFMELFKLHFAKNK